MPNPFNPLDWVKSAQDWFSRTEKSSGFRPYLIFMIIHVGFALVVLAKFQGSEIATKFVINTLYLSIGGFVLMFAFKAIQDPGFCRSEKHIETVKRIEMTEQKGDMAPKPIDLTNVKVIQNPDSKALNQPTGGDLE